METCRRDQPCRFPLATHGLPIVPPLLAPIVASAGLGALIGLIRQWSDQSSPEGSIDLAGVRTYTFWSMLGCLGAYFNDTYSPAVLPLVLTLVGAHQIVALSRVTMPKPPGGTTFASMLLTLFVGALVFWHHYQAAALVAATTMLMIGLKQPLHAWTRTFKAEDIRAMLQFAAITGVILPLVPNRDFGPFAAFNPYSIWLMVVLISGLGFTGYIAMRFFGERAGILLTSLLGGLASSTASTLAFSRRSREAPALSAHFSLAVVIACSVMLPRVLIATSVLDRELAGALLLPFGLMLLPAVLYGLWRSFTRQAATAPQEVPTLANPLSLKTAIKFALLYGLISFLVKAATQLDLLQHGLLPLSFVSGLTDMDAISLSMAKNHASDAVPLTLAARAVIVAAIANSLLKAGFALSLGSPALKREVTLVLGATAAAGVASLWLV